MRANSSDMKAYDTFLNPGTKYANTKIALTGPLTVTKAMGPILSLDANGAARTITFPTKGSRFFFLVQNMTGAANSLTLNDSAAASLGTVAQNKTALVWDDGVQTVALISA